MHVCHKFVFLILYGIVCHGTLYVCMLASTQEALHTNTTLEYDASAVEYHLTWR